MSRRIRICCGSCPRTGAPKVVGRVLRVFRRRELVPVEAKKLFGDEKAVRVIQCGAGQTWVDPRVGASWVVGDTTRARASG